MTKLYSDKGDLCILLWIRYCSLVWIHYRTDRCVRGCSDQNVYAVYRMLFCLVFLAVKETHAVYFLLVERARGINNVATFSDDEDTTSACEDSATKKVLFSMNEPCECLYQLNCLVVSKHFVKMLPDDIKTFPKAKVKFILKLCRRIEQLTSYFIRINRCGSIVNRFPQNIPLKVFVINTRIFCKLNDQHSDFVITWYLVYWDSFRRDSRNPTNANSLWDRSSWGVNDHFRWGLCPQ